LFILAIGGLFFTSEALFIVSY